VATYAQKFRAALIACLGPDKVVFMPGWDKQHRGIGWRGKGGVPSCLFAHHTAGAPTSSTDPKHAGNRKGAGKGQVDFVQSHYEVPASGFTLDRDGTVYVHSIFPVWHAGLGSFRGVSPFSSLGIPDDQANDYALGVEIVSKGITRDFTVAQKWSFGYLAEACRRASGWRGFWKRLPNHRTWAPTRKVDTRYELASLRLWAARARARLALLPH
jgi:hypothetical protein